MEKAQAPWKGKRLLCAELRVATNCGEGCVHHTPFHPPANLVVFNGCSLRKEIIVRSTAHGMDGYDFPNWALQTDCKVMRVIITPVEQKAPPFRAVLEGKGKKRPS